MFEIGFEPYSSPTLVEMSDPNLPRFWHSARVSPTHVLKDFSFNIIVDF